MSMKKVLTFIAAILTMFGCNSQKKNAADAEGKAPKYLVVYYSQTGTTQQVAQEIARQLGADTLRIDVEQPYSGTYDETIERCKKEMANGELPKLKGFDTDFADYDVIFLGYPIWFGTYALPMSSFIKSVDLSGKKVVPFCTFGSGGLAASSDSLKKAQPKAEIMPGYGVRTARISKAKSEIDRFLKENGYIEGKVEKLPEYSAQQPVTDAEADIFNAACGDYKFPLGTPVTVGKRSTSQGTDYKFTAQSKDAGGNAVEAVIYVTVDKGPNAKPEFTEVVR